MHWLETIFGLAPDHGDGSTEFAIAFCLIAAVATIVGVAARKRRTALAR